MRTAGLRERSGVARGYQADAYAKAAALPLNKERLSDDGARYLLADWEWFTPVDEPNERFANKQRIRAGLGYRPSFKWRFEFLYMWTRSRNTIEEGFSMSENMIDLRVKRVF